MAKKVMRGGAMLAPVPAVMVSVGDENEKNIITVAWCGTLSTTPPKTYISVRPSRHSYEIIKRTGEFVINLVPVSLAKSADYCGIYTGAKVVRNPEYFGMLDLRNFYPRHAVVFLKLHVVSRSPRKPF